MREALRRLLEAARAAHASEVALTHTLRGEIYEELALWALEERLGPLGLRDLRRVGRSGDRGVDLVGNWHALDFLVQCKSTRSKISGALWRDLSGVSTQRAKGTPTPSLVALVSPMPMTKAGHVEFMSSDQPLLHFLVPWTSQFFAEMGVPALRASVLNLAAENLMKAHKISVEEI